MPYAEQSLRGFERVSLQPGETATVRFTLDRRDLSYYDAGRIRLARRGRPIRNPRLRLEPGSSLARGHPGRAGRRSARAGSARGRACYYDLSNGIDVPDDAFAALLGRPIPQRERAPGDPFTPNTTLREAEGTVTGRILVGVGRRAAKRMQADEEVGGMVDYLLFESPLRMLTMSGGGFGPKQVDALVMMLNGRFSRGLFHMFGK
jgi:beta-glucosidase